MSFAPPDAATSWRPPLSLLLSAALWGLTWYPFRLLEARGVDGLWAIVLAELIAVAACLVVFRAGLSGMRDWPLVWIGLLAGACNTGYVVGAIEGEVMRVTLLLYLSPLWTLVLAHWLLGEHIDRRGVAVIGLSLSGALVMLWPLGDAGEFTLADTWGLVAGVCYAGYNVLSRRHLELSVAHKTFAGSAGCVVVALALLPLAGGAAPGPLDHTALGLLAGVGTMMVAIVILMQYGLERMPAGRAIVILVSELIFASLSAWWLADETPGLRELLGAVLIAAACLISARAAAADTAH